MSALYAEKGVCPFGGDADDNAEDDISECLETGVREGARLCVSWYDVEEAPAELQRMIESARASSYPSLGDGNSHNGECCVEFQKAADALVCV